MPIPTVETMRSKPRVRVLALTAALAVWALVLTSCQGKASKSQVDVTVESPADMEKLEQLEKERRPTPASVAGVPGYQVLDGVPVEKLPEYRLGSGDVLEIVYHIHYEKNPEDYRFEVQDKINVVFPFQPQFSSTVIVRTDGRISLPLVGDVMVESMTPKQLSAELNKRYSKYILNPNITISLQEFNVKIDELKKAITTAPRGQSKTAPITPDGRVSLPIIGNMQAAGLTVREMEKLINERYGAYVRNLQTTLIVSEIHHMKYYILGEVDKPGAYEMPGRPNLLTAIAMAGGHKNSAAMSDVVVVRSEGLQKPVIFKVDLEKAMADGVVYPGLTVQPADIIFVPKTKLDKANDMIAKIFTKGLYSIIPFSSSFTVNYDLTDTYKIR